MELGGLTASRDDLRDNLRHRQLLEDPAVHARAEPCERGAERDGVDGAMIVGVHQLSGRHDAVVHERRVRGFPEVHHCVAIDERAEIEIDPTLLPDPELGLRIHLELHLHAEGPAHRVAGFERDDRGLELMGARVEGIEHPPGRQALPLEVDAQVITHDRAPRSGVGGALRRESVRRSRPTADTCSLPDHLS